MKYTIEGFSQECALTLRKTVPDGKGKTKEIRVDCTDLVILRWFVDFFPNMRKMDVDGRQFAWVSYKKLLDDLPILDISKKSCSERLRKLAEFGILEFALFMEGGTYTLYTFGPNYLRMVASDDGGATGQPVGGTGQPVGVTGQPVRGYRSTGKGVTGQPVTKDTSIIDTSIKDVSIRGTKERKEEGAGTGGRTTFDEIIEAHTKDPELKGAILDYIRMRKRIGRPLTDRGLHVQLNKLDELGETAEEKIRILEQSIGNGWFGLFRVKDEGTSASPRPKQAGGNADSNGNVFLELLNGGMEG